MIIDVINDSRMEEYLMVAIWDLLFHNVITWSGQTTTNRLAIRNVGLHNAYKLHVYSVWCSCPSSPDGTLERKTELTNDIEQNRGNF